MWFWYSCNCGIDETKVVRKLVKTIQPLPTPKPDCKVPGPMIQKHVDSDSHQVNAKCTGGTIQIHKVIFLILHTFFTSICLIGTV